MVGELWWDSCCGRVVEESCGEIVVVRELW